jgi:hypothetical protein
MQFSCYCQKQTITQWANIRPIWSPCFLPELVDKIETCAQTMNAFIGRFTWVFRLSSLKKTRGQCYVHRYENFCRFKNNFWLEKWRFS